MIFFFGQADRCLVTGNNSTVECWQFLTGDLALPVKHREDESGRQLFMYEDVKNCGVTHRFLDQQISIADQVLGKFLRMSDQKEIDREAYRDLLQNCDISASVKQFCETVKSEYDFAPYALASLKRHFYLEDDTLRKEYEKFVAKL